MADSKVSKKTPKHIWILKINLINSNISIYYTYLSRSLARKRKRDLVVHRNLYDKYSSIEGPFKYTKERIFLIKN